MLRCYALFRFLLFGAGCALLLAPASFAQEDSEPIMSFDHYVPHISTAPALAGQSVKLHVRERVAATTEGNDSRPVVLFVHGTPGSSVPVFDNPFKDYSWMAAVAAADFDAFAMNITASVSRPGHSSWTTRAMPAPINRNCSCRPRYRRRARRVTRICCRPRSPSGMTWMPW